MKNFTNLTKKIFLIICLLLIIKHAAAANCCEPWEKFILRGGFSLVRKFGNVKCLDGIEKHLNMSQVA